MCPNPNPNPDPNPNQVRAAGCRREHSASCRSATPRGPCARLLAARAALAARVWVRAPLYRRHLTGLKLCRHPTEGLNLQPMYCNMHVTRRDVCIGSARGQQLTTSVNASGSVQTVVLHTHRDLTRHKTARPSHCGRAACLPSNVLQIPFSSVPTHPHVKSNVSAVMRAGAGAAELPLGSFPEGSGVAVRAIPPPALPPPQPALDPPQCLPIPVPTQPLLSELNGDRHGDPRRS